MVQWFYEGGTKHRVFEEYFSQLVENLLKKYPERKLCFLADNLWAHKSDLIMKII